MLYGQMFIKRIHDTLRSNPALWLKTLLIITYDEHGGFYDHVIPPTAEIRALSSTTSAVAAMNALATGASAKAPITIPYGVRVPTLVVSPWVPAGKGPDITLDHCSILKTILARFCGASKPFLSDRVNASLTFNAFLTQSQPRLGEIPPSPTIPTLPDVSPALRSLIVTKPVSRRALQDGDADFHELSGMVARMLGRPYARYDKVRADPVAFADATGRK
jgi:phospholipase C